MLQTPKLITIINQGGPEVRRIYTNVAHSPNPKLSWNGESVGHYEGNNTLVVDTVGFNDRTFIDNYRTPHTTKLHVIERFVLADDGKTIEITVSVEDPGAFTTSWFARQRWKSVERGPMVEDICSENSHDYLNQWTSPEPMAGQADF